MKQVKVIRKPWHLKNWETNQQLSQGHPLYASNADEDLADLAKVKLDDVKKYYTDFYGANNSISAFVGELDKKVITDFLQTTFGKWNSKENYKEVETQFLKQKQPQKPLTPRIKPMR